MKKILFTLIALYLSSFLCNGQTCNNWLSTPSINSFVNIGQLNISGNQVTIEATINRTAPYLPGGGNNTEGDIVSKHNDFSDVNYLLRPNHGYITTTNGFFGTPDICNLELNKTYHVAMVYDGSTLKFYRNGFLMSQVNATGNLIQNNWKTRFGLYDASFYTTQLIGYINEVRIWNVARTQSQLQAYISLSLPAPTTQSGLLGYYTFDNLINKQGNIAYNGTLGGAAAINATNPNCTFIADSCGKVAIDSLIINTYTPVIALNSCQNKITVEDAFTFNIGDTVLMIQMKGAVIDTSNTAAFGNITNYKNAGNYEFNYVKSKSGNIIELKNVLLRQYDLPDGRVQLIRVPYYKSVTFSNTLTCLPWDGKKGGVLVFNVKDTINLNTDIDVSGKGFRGGREENFNTAGTNCGENDFFYTLGNIFGAAKGEGIAEVSEVKLAGKGKLANGGGGGNDHNSGGGGGSNATIGGKGGNQFNLCNGAPVINAGIAGFGLTNYTTQNKIYLGGGGGSGHANDPGSDPFTSGGGKGGALIIISSGYLQSNNYKIKSNGGAGTACTGSNCNEGAGGGGAGGSVLLSVNNFIDKVTTETVGGNGANTGPFLTFITGPGGGGSGGIVWFKQNVNPSGATLGLTGGVNGVNTTAGNDAWGALPGSAGLTFNNLVLPITTIPFKKNIDSVKINSTAGGCKIFTFNGLAFFKSYAIQNWQWTFGDGTAVVGQNISHTFNGEGSFNVKLVITDINGCKDSVTKSISVAACLETIINTYTPIVALSTCDNKITVEDGSTFNTGDTVLIIQMKGAEIDSSNTASFGTVTNYKNAGNYEFNYVKSKAGNIIELKDSLTRTYDVPKGKVQLIRVPYYNTANIAATITCLPWDGSKGGVLVLNAKDSVNLQADINLTGKGFRGGNSPNTGSQTLYCFENNYSYPSGSLTAADKGEGIALIGNGIAWGKGYSANAGGSGLGHNSGGGGGSNGGAGGLGGYQLEACGSAPFDNRGIGANNLLYNNSQNKIFLGGGGGSGHVDNGGGSDMRGGNGGGIILIRSNYLKTNGYNIVSNGGDAPQCSSPPYGICHDGGGGGGGGGTILISTSNYLTPAQLNVVGGKGADLSIFDPSAGAGRIGPGGGGGAGVTWLGNPSLPGTVSTILTGGINGVIPADNNNPWGSAAGKTGINLFNLSLPIDTKPFRKNIDSVVIKVTPKSCSSFEFIGLAYIQNYSIRTWLWDFGDGKTSNESVITHPYTTPGTYIVSLTVMDNKGCIDSVKKNVLVTGTGVDFSYHQNACNPLNVEFSGIGDAPVNPLWLFGDGTSATGIKPTHLYSSTGTYAIKYTAQNGACTDTITKNISINILRQDIVLTHDTTICFGIVKQLLTVPSLSFCWSPTTYLNDPTLANPTTNTPVTITYFFTAEIPGSNIITNGDFSAGNTGFTSQYNFASPNITEGQYFVGPNPSNWNGALSPCGDHTSGNGGMMLVNGAPMADVLVWNQTVTVTPNTNYAFSTWIEALYTPNPAQLRFSINGGDVGTLITATLPTCTWTQFYTTWNSGNNTTANIAIVNKNTIVQGNDFGLDDISFSPVLIKRDSVIITVDHPVVKANNDTAICAGKSVQLTASGGNNYNWSPSTGLTNAGIANPVATPPGNTQYIVTGTDNKGCSAADTVAISTKASPVVTITAGTAICKNSTVQLQATGGTTYQWLPVTGLNNSSISNPVASPVNTTTYSVIVTGTNSCTTADSVNISIRPGPVFTISPADTTCFNTAVQLLATGGDVYAWSPVSLVSNPNIANPITNNNNNATYTVVIKELTCNNATTLTTTVAVLPVPAIKASKLNDIDCSFAAAQLQTTGTGQFSWSPAGTLNNSAVANPLASPTITTLYTVSAVDFTTNCIATDTITVFVNKGGASSFYIPSAFTPNGDGVNDCFKVSHFNFIKSVDISIYNRYGSLVFHTTTNDCWNGTYRGKRADPGNYVYYIKAEDNCNKFYKKGNLVLIR